MNFNLHKHTIFLTLSGSRAYGIATPESDYDYKGIAIPPIYNYLVDKFEQSVDTDKGKHVWKHYPGLVDEDADMQVMELTKFARLASGCNPNVIEHLFCTEDVFIKAHPIMNRLLDIKESFLSKQAKSRFCGYAHSQLQRIFRHQRWLRNPPTHSPIRAEFDLPEHSLMAPDQIGAAEALIQREIDEFMVDQTHVPEDVRIELKEGMGKMMRAIWLALNPEKEYPVGVGKQFLKTEDALYDGAAKTNGLFSENFIVTLNAEKRYRAAQKEWTNYQTWLKNRNPARAELEAKYGYDTKHGAHLVRLIRMAREILETGTVNVKRPDAEEILSIRNGAWSFEKIVEFAESEDKALTKVAKESKLPRSANTKKIHQVICNMVVDFNKELNPSLRVSDTDIEKVFEKANANSSKTEAR